MDNGASSYRRFLDGDDSAFDEIMEEVFYSLVFFINRYVRDVHAAEDIAIDVMSELIVHKKRYNFKVSLKTYLFMIGRSRAIDYLRHLKVTGVETLTEICEPADDAVLEEAVLRDEKRREVGAAVAKLPHDMRVAVHLIYFEDMTYKEAAKVMKKSAKQIDNLLYRAKKELRAILGEDGGKI